MTQTFQVVTKNRFTGETFVLGAFETIQEANALKLRANAWPSLTGKRKTYQVVQAA